MTNTKTIKKVNPLVKMSDTNLLLAITIAVFFLMYIGAVVFQGGGFTKPQMFFNLLNTNAGLIIAACGMSIVMVSGSIDISIGGVVALVSMSCAVYLDHHNGSVAGSIAIALAIGLAFGLIQGFLIAYLDVQPFIVTLAGLFFARGMTTIIHTKPFNVVNKEFTALKLTRLNVPGMGSYNKKGVYIPAYIEIGVVVALVLVIILFLVLRYTKLGRAFYALGGNRQSALMLGVNVKRTRFLSHLICSGLAGVAGYVYFLHVGSGAASHAMGMEMNAIASSIIGGTMLTGGVGNIIGTLFGVFSLGTIQNIVSSAGLDQAWWTGITIAAMLCIFLLIQSIVIKWKKRALK